MLINLIFQTVIYNILNFHKNNKYVIEVFAPTPVSLIIFVASAFWVFWRQDTFFGRGVVFSFFFSYVAHNGQTPAFTHSSLAKTTCRIYLFKKETSMPSSHADSLSFSLALKAKRSNPAFSSHWVKDKNWTGHNFLNSTWNLSRSSLGRILRHTLWVHLRLSCKINSFLSKMQLNIAISASPIRRVLKNFCPTVQVKGPRISMSCLGVPVLQRYSCKIYRF